MNTTLNPIIAITTFVFGFGLVAQSAIVVIETSFPSNGNGGFELDSAGNFYAGGDQTNNSIGWSFGDTTSLGAAYEITQVLAANSVTDSSEGSYAGALYAQEGRGLIQNTGFNLNANYTFSLNFDWLDDNNNWGNAADKVEVRLFTSSDDTITGTLTALYSADFTKTADGTYTTETVSGYLPGTAATSRDLWITFSSVGNDTFNIARVDEVYLELSAVAPEPSSMALMLIGTLGLFKRRRSLR